jgi:adenine phosphoribosyltransferase
MGIEARGFIIGGALAYAVGKGFIPVRKPGKLPAESISYEYELEYGKGTLEVHVDALKKGDKVLLIDDLLANRWDSAGRAKLAEQLGAKVVEMAFIIDLPDVGGRKSLSPLAIRFFI